MKKYTLILFFLISNLTFGQDSEDLTETYITTFREELKNKNVDDFFVVNHIQYGTVQISSDFSKKNYCEKEGYYYRMYVFWKEGNEHWVKVFDHCGGFVPIELRSNRAIDFYNKHFENIKLEEVERYKRKPDSLANGKVYSFISMQSHTPLRHFWFYKDSIELKKRFDEYDLTSNRKSPNINYKKNNNLKLVRLNKICEAIIEKFVKTEEMVREE